MPSCWLTSPVDIFQKSIFLQRLFILFWMQMFPIMVDITQMPPKVFDTTTLIWTFQRYLKTIKCRNPYHQSEHSILSFMFWFLNRLTKKLKRTNDDDGSSHLLPSKNSHALSHPRGRPLACLSVKAHVILGGLKLHLYHECKYLGTISLPLKVKITVLVFSYNLIFFYLINVISLYPA